MKKKQRTISMSELSEQMNEDMGLTVGAVQIEKLRAIEGEDFLSEESTHKPISIDTIKFMASYKQAPKQNPFSKL